MKRKIGVWLLVAAYAIFLYISISAPFYARAHQHMDAVMLAEYSSPWLAALTGSLGFIGIVLALIPIRRGERWAVFTSFASFAILFVTRMATDPRCLVVLDVHQHGCHTFIIAVVLGVAGLILVSFGRQNRQN
jgi:hypothetical protein